MDRYTLLVAVISVLGVLQRLLREDVKWFPALAAPWRGVVVAVLGMVAAPTLDAVVNGTPWTAALTTGILAIVPTVLNVIASLTASRAATKAAAHVASLFCLAVLLGGCAVSLEEARLAGVPERAANRQTRLTSATPPGIDCLRLDRQHIAWDMAAKASAFAAGSSGLATWPIKDDGWRVGLGVAAGILAVNAIADEVASQGWAAEWARYCSEGQP